MKFPEEEHYMFTSQMRQPIHNGVKLPRQLLEKIGISDDPSGTRTFRNGPGARKDRRKSLREQKKSKNAAQISNVPVKSSAVKGNRKNSESQEAIHEQGHGRSERPKSILKNKSHATVSCLPRKEKSLPGSVSLPSKAPRDNRAHLSADDAEIAALEKALGVKGDGVLPKSFVDDGLDLLLEDLEDSPVKSDALRSKRKYPGDEEWLHKKRQKATCPGPSANGAWEGFSSEGSTDGSTNSDSSDEGQLMDGDDESESVDPSTERSSFPKSHALKVKENPYKPPVVFSTDQNPPKYIPPSLRAKDPSDSEDLTRLRRQLQGLINRLSEANLVSILREIESLYRSNPRQHVSSILLDLLIGLLCDKTSLQDTFIILHAGFIAAIYKVIGTDFGAQAIQKIDNAFLEYYESEKEDGSNGRRSANLVSLLAQLYNFQVISCNLIYDFIRLFLEEITETSAELVLKLMRSSGPQLRQDGASSLKDIIMMLQSAISKTGEENLSVRTKFMVETMNNLKNNRMKTGIAASNIASDHIIRMKKTLGTLNTQNIRGIEPLRVGLEDLRDSEKRGKWWLVGASYKDKTHEDCNQDESNQGVQLKGENETLNNTATDLIQLAREQRMNTDVRRSIFVAIMSATDYKDAHNRISKLRLKKNQELEIPRVLIHCASAEENYNPFYSLISRRVCSERKLKMAFQFSLWNLFKRMGEDRESKQEDPDDDEDKDDELQLRSIVNLAKLFGVLIAEDGLGIGVLKVLEFAYLQPKTRTFLELLLISIILHSQPAESRNEERLIEIFIKAKDVPDLAPGLRFFLKKVVSKTDLAGSRQDSETVRWGCKVAGDVLKVIASSRVADE